MNKRINLLISCFLFLMTGCSTVKEPVLSVEEIRTALAASNIENEEERSQAVAYYEELLARDALDKTDYQTLANLYQKEKDPVNQRRILRKLFMLDPTLENARLLSEAVVILDLQDEKIAEMNKKITQGMMEKDPVFLKEQISSEIWKQNFQEEDGLIEMKLTSQDEEGVFQIRTFSFETEITWKKKSGELFYFRINEAGSLLAELKMEGMAYSGAGKLDYYDENQELIKEVQCTLKEDHCVDSITILYNGMTFQGALNEDGTTAVAQIDSEKRQQNVVYAMSADGSSYLVQSGIDAADFIMDLDFLRLPVYVAWAEE